MKRYLLVIIPCILFGTMNVLKVSATGVFDPLNYKIVELESTKTNYFSKMKKKLNSLYGLEVSSLLSSGSCSGNDRSITAVSVNCRISSGSSRYVLRVKSPTGNIATKSCGASSLTYNLTEFKNEDPYGQWEVSIITQGDVLTVTGTLKVSYSY